MQAFKGMRSLITNSIFTATDAKGSNLLWAGINYKGAPCATSIALHGASIGTRAFQGPLHASACCCSGSVWERTTLSQCLSCGHVRAGADPDRPAEPLPERKAAEAQLESALLSLQDPGCKSAAQLRDMLAAHGLQVRAQHREEKTP
jgi:hypothetical protein